MGAEASKIDVNSIDENVNNLVVRLRANKTKVHERVVFLIKTALAIYSNILQKPQNNTESVKHRLRRISEAIRALDHLPIYDEKPINPGLHGNKWQEQLTKSKSYMKIVRNSIRSNRIEAQQYEQYLQMITEYSQQLDSIPKRVLSDKKIKEAKNEMAILCLEIFIKTPAHQEKFALQKTKAVESDINTTCEELDRIIKILSNINRRNCNNESVKLKLKCIHKTTTEYLNIDEKIEVRTSVVTLPNSNMKPPNVKSHFEGSISSDNFKNAKDKKVRRSRIIAKSKPVDNKKQATFRNHLASTSQPESSRSEIDRNITKERDYSKKIDDTTSQQKVAECYYNLNQIKKTLDQYATNVNQTSFFATSDEYQRKTNEIVNLRKRLNNISDLSQEIVSYKRILSDEITQILTTLEKNAKDKEKQDQYLQDLQNIENQINSVNDDSNYEQKRNKLNNCRKFANSINVSDPVVCARKAQINNKIQNLQRDFDVAENKFVLWQVNNTLDEHKIFIQQHSGSFDTYKQKKEEIAALRDCLNNLPRCNQEIESNKQILLKEIQETLNILEDKANIQSDVMPQIEKIFNLDSNLWKIRAYIDKYQSEAQQFGCPISNYMYERKKNEINALLENLKRVPEDRPNIKEEKRTLYNKIHEILNILYLRALKNEEKHSPWKAKQKPEKKFNLKESVKNNMWKTKSLVDKYKLEVLKFVFPASSKEYEAKRNEIVALLENLKNIPGESINDNAEKETLSIEIHEMLNNLDRTALANEKTIGLGENKEKIQHTTQTSVHSTVSQQKFKEVFDPVWNNLSKLKSSLDSYKLEAQNFNYPVSTKAYSRKRDEITALLENLQKKPQEDTKINQEKHILSSKIHEILNILEKKARKNEEINRSLETLSTIEIDAINASKSDLPTSKKIQMLGEFKKKVYSIDDFDDEVKAEKCELLKTIKTSEESIKKQEGKNEASATKTLKILDLQEYFSDFKLDYINVPRESTEFIQIIKRQAETFKDKVAQYKGTNYSVEYFVIDENLMRLLEELDKIKCQNNKPLLDEKIRTIDYIKELHRQLDKNAVED